MAVGRDAEEQEERAKHKRAMKKLRDAWNEEKEELEATHACVTARS